LLLLGETQELKFEKFSTLLSYKERRLDQTEASISSIIESAFSARVKGKEKKKRITGVRGTNNTSRGA
jgi:hypothetical protein